LGLAGAPSAGIRPSRRASFLGVAVARVASSANQQAATPNENQCRKATSDANQEKEIVHMTTDRISSAVSRLWKSTLALGALTLIVGAAVLVWPGQSIVVAGVLFGVYLLASGIAQVVAAFTVYAPAASRVLLFISGALSIVLGVFAFRDFNDGAAVWLLTLWIGIGFIFQGVSSSVLAISLPKMPDRGWYIFAGVLTVIAGTVVLVWPISSIVVLAIVAGVWLVVIGTTQIVWALSARSTAKEVEQDVEPLMSSAAG
jgi:uncharacterized membrane protein HdeD (DUF308 family)